MNDNLETVQLLPLTSDIVFKQVFGQEFKLVTPGIRPQGSDAGDQRRIMTPEQALSAGVDYMVIGRPVTQSVDPAQTLKAINASLQRSA